MSEKYYAVRRGIRQGIFDSWAECQMVTRGYSGAEYKKFTRMEDAEAYMCGEDVGNTSSNSLETKSLRNSNSAVVFACGKSENCDVMLGLCVQSKHGTVSATCMVDARNYLTSGNTAEEAIAVMAGIELAVDLGYTDLTVVYAYQGIREFYDGTWRAKSELWRIFSSVLNNMRTSKGLSIKFVNVKKAGKPAGYTLAKQLCTSPNTKYTDINLVFRGVLKADNVFVR